MGLTRLQEAKQYLVNRIRFLSEEILPGWYPVIVFASKGPKDRPHTFAGLTGGLMYVDPQFVWHSLKRGTKSYKLVVNETFLRDNMANIQAIDMERILVHELEHVPDVWAFMQERKGLVAQTKAATNVAMRGKISPQEYKAQTNVILRQMKQQNTDWHEIPRFREAVKARTGSVVDSLPATTRVSELAFVGRGEALAPVVPRFMYRCPLCGHVGSYTPEYYAPVTRRTKAGGKTIHLPRIGEGVRCERCKKFMPADTRAIKLTPRERADLMNLARAHDALPYENMARKGLPFNYPLYQKKEIPLGKIPTQKLMKAIPRVRSIL